MKTFLEYLKYLQIFQLIEDRGKTVFDGKIEGFGEQHTINDYNNYEKVNIELKKRYCKR